jgi:hypothetical protein
MPRPTRVFKPIDEVVLMMRDEICYKRQLVNLRKTTED